MAFTPRAATPQSETLGQRPGSNLSHYGYGKRATSATSARSTALPSTRPGSSLATSRVPSRNSDAATPSRDGFWREDVAWPVLPGGTAAEPGKNTSLDVDLNLARRSLEKYAGDRNRSWVVKKYDPEAHKRAAPSKTIVKQASPKAIPAASNVSDERGHLGDDSKKEVIRKPGTGKDGSQTRRLKEVVPPIFPGEGIEPGDPRRRKLVSWCFQVPKEQVEYRFGQLDIAVFNPDHRAAVYLMREDEAEEDSRLYKLMNLYKECGIEHFKQAVQVANLDFWPIQDGGISRTCEILTGLEVLNFYRWMCGVPRLQIDSYLQEMSTMMLQVIQKRNERPLFKATDKVESFCEHLDDFELCEGLHLALISHVPCCSAAIHLMFTGLPESPTCDGGPRAAFGHSNPELPEKAEASLDMFIPLLMHAHDHGSEDEEAEEQRGLSHISASHSESGHGRRRARATFVPNGPPASLPAPPGSAPPPGAGFNLTYGGSSSSQTAPRNSSTWGDLKGVVALRRQALDPRLTHVGLQRRGCNFCLWAPPHEIDGLPEEDQHEESEPEEDFLDEEKVPEVVTRKPKTEGCAELQQLLKWRQDENWRSNRRRSGEAGEPITLADTLAPLEEQKVEVGNAGVAWKAVQRTFKQTRAKIAYARVTMDGSSDVQSRTQNYLLKLKERNPLLGVGKSVKQFDIYTDKDSASQPVMVCFPPPGVVPLELMSEAELMPWTVSPDPTRLAPTLNSTVKVFRVKIDHLVGDAKRLGSELPLLNFCVDSTNVGTSFCVIFTPDVDLKDGDEFEVVLSGLADRARPSNASCSLQYLISFQRLRRQPHDKKALRERSEHLLEILADPSLWEEAVIVYPDEGDGGGGGDGGFSKRARAPKKDGGGGGNARSGGALKSCLKKRPVDDEDGNAKPQRQASEVSTKEKRRVRIVEEKKTMSFDQRHPPPIGLVAHPFGTASKSQQGVYNMLVKGTNEVTMAFIIPSSVVIKAQLFAFLKSQAKWEVMPHAVMMMSFDMPRKGGAGRERRQLLKNGKSSEKAPEKVMEAHGNHKTRIIMQIMIPTAGHFELRFQWGLIPTLASQAPQFRGVRAAVTPFEHKLRVVFQAPATEAGGPKSLIPSLLHTSIHKFGYPAKHILSEQWGITLVHPLRYRLKRCQDVRFIVYSTQEPLAEDKKIVTEQSEQKRKSRREQSSAEGDMDEQDLMYLQDSQGKQKPTSEAQRQRLRKTLGKQMRIGRANCQICIAAVLGNWQRIEILQRRILEPRGEHGEFQQAEVHEAFVRLTFEDVAQSVQLVVFQVAADIALNSSLAAMVAEGKDRDAAKKEEAQHEGPVIIGKTPRPSYWVLAEYTVDSAGGPMPYDEDEMAKPPPPPPDAIELIRNLGVGRPVKLQHQTDDEPTAPNHKREDD
mmetsp:Transcript_24411/g.44230  ORF Transcript_24411/g.44230 Transcript_24411/m.44230 type:complete len:1399 (+) Transcript_24411:64-4260(+)